MERAAGPKPNGARFGPRFTRALPPAVGALSEAPSRAPVATRDNSYRGILATADGVAALVALYAAVTLIGDDRLRPASLLVVPIVIVASKLMGLYDRDELVIKRTTLEDSAALFHLATIFTLITWLLDDVMVDGYLGNQQVLGLWALLYVMSLAGRTVAREVARRRAPTERCLLVGRRSPTLAERQESGRSAAGRRSSGRSARPRHRRCSRARSGFRWP